MEETFTLNTDDGFKIYGLLNKAPNPLDKAVIFAHGLTGHPHEHHYQTGRRYFNERGYDVVRFSFYTDLEKARRLIDATLADHAKDLTTVINHFDGVYEKLYVAGHSYGRLTTIIANPGNVNAVSLWDPSISPYEGFWKDEATYISEIGLYTINWNVQSLFGKEMYEESKIYTESKTKELVSVMCPPTQLILVKDSIVDGVKSNIYDSIPNPKEKQVITGATHVFVEGDTVFDLLEKTYTWFEKF